MLTILRPSDGFPLPKGVRLRILGRADIPLLVDHLLGLDAEARNDRFNGGVNDSWIRSYAERCIEPGVMVIAAETEGRVVGVAELHPDKPDSAEAAFSVSKEMRGHGIGAALFALILEAAWSRGLTFLDLSTHSDNTAMKALARQFGAVLKFSGAETSARIDLSDVHFEEEEEGARPVRTRKSP